MLGAALHWPGTPSRPRKDNPVIFTDFVPLLTIALLLEGFPTPDNPLFGNYQGLEGHPANSRPKGRADSGGSASKGQAIKTEMIHLGNESKSLSIYGNWGWAPSSLHAIGGVTSLGH